MKGVINLNKKDYCKCKNSSGVHTVTDNWYQYDVCNDCGKILEDGIRPLNDNGDINVY